LHRENYGLNESSTKTDASLRLFQRIWRLSGQTGDNGHNKGFVSHISTNDMDPMSNMLLMAIGRMMSGEDRNPVCPKDELRANIQITRD
jgi:hypothetical protein